MLNLECYGVPSTFSFKSETCKSCKKFSDCQKEVHSELLSAPDLSLVASLIAQHETFTRSNSIESTPKTLPNRFALTSAQLDSLEGLPKKVQAFIRGVWSKGIDKRIEQRLKQGKSAFNENTARPYHLAHKLLQRGALSKSELSTAFMTELGWTRQSAQSQTSMIWHIFPALGLAEHDGLKLANIKKRDI